MHDRLSVSIPEELLNGIDEFVGDHGHTGRSASPRGLAHPPRSFRTANSRASGVDLVVRREDPDDGRRSLLDHSVIPVDDFATTLSEADFEDISIEPKGDSNGFIRGWSDERDLSEYVVSATIEARKP